MAPASHISLASPIYHILAYEMDENEISQLSSQLIDILSMLFKHRHVQALSHEIKLVVSLVYHFSSILSSYQTPGHNFCGLMLFQESIRQIRPNVSLTMFRKLRNANKSLMMLVPFYQASIPYLYNRRYDICISISSVVQFLMSDETAHSRVRRRDSHTHQQATSDDIFDSGSHNLSTSEDHSGGATLNGSENSENDFITRWTERCQQQFKEFNMAIYRAWMQVASDSSSRIDLLMNTLKEAYFMLFCIYGKYYEMAFALLKVTPLLTERHRQRLQMSWRVFGYITGIRLSIICISACRQIYHQWRSVRALQEAQINIYVQTTSAEASHTNTSESLDEEPTDLMKCPLCMDPVKQPSVTPCGHIYCWTCIVPWTQRQKPRGNALHTTMKCPVCRMSLKPQSLRPVYL